MSHHFFHQSTTEQIPRIFLFVGVVAETGFWARSTTAYKNESHNLIVTETVKLFFVFLEATTSVGVSDFKCTGFGWSILEDVSVLGPGSLIWGKREIIRLMAGHIHHSKHSLPGSDFTFPVWRVDSCFLLTNLECFHLLLAHWLCSELLSFLCSIYEKLIQFCSIDELGTNYPKVRCNTFGWQGSG